MLYTYTWLHGYIHIVVCNYISEIVLEKKLAKNAMKLLYTLFACISFN